MQQAPILIIGKNGKTGARVDQRLQAMGYTTRPVSRSTNPSFDWENPATWRSAIEGTHAAYVTYQPDLAVPNAEATIRAFVQVAAKPVSNTSFCYRVEARKVHNVQRKYSKPAVFRGTS